MRGWGGSELGWQVVLSEEWKLALILIADGFLLAISCDD